MITMQLTTESCYLTIEPDMIHHNAHQGGTSMRLEQLQYLITTANCHSMHKAGEILHVSQQNISKAILSLEKELACKLFDRTTSGLYLTNAGERVYLLASEVCKCTDKISSIFDESNDLAEYYSIKGQFTVASIPGYSSVIHNAFVHLHRKCPNIAFRTEELESLDVVAYLLNGQCQWGITTLDNDFQLINDPAFWQEFDVFILRRDDLKVLTTLSSPLLQFQSISDKQLMQQPLVIYNTSNSRLSLVQQLLQRERLPFQTFMDTNSSLVFNEAIITQNAVALSADLVIKSAIRKNYDNMILLPLTHKIPIAHVIIKKKNISTIGQLFDRFVLQTFQEFGIIPQPYIPTLESSEDS